MMADAAEIARRLSPRMKRTLLAGDLYRCNWGTFSALRLRGLVDTVPPRLTDLGREVDAALRTTDRPIEAELSAYVEDL